MDDWTRYKDMFDSEYFTEHMKIYYLHKLIKNHQATAYLLQKFTLHELNFYLP